MLTICTTNLVIGPPATQYLPPRGCGALLELLIISLNCGHTYDVTTHEWLREKFTSNLANIGILNSHRINSTWPNFILIPENEPRELVDVLKEILKIWMHWHFNIISSFQILLSRRSFYKEKVQSTNTKILHNGGNWWKNVVEYRRPLRSYLILTTNLLKN